MNNLNTTLLSVTNSIFFSLTSFLPILLGALLTIIVGFVLAGWAKNLTVRVLKFVKLSKISSSKALSAFFSHAQISQTVEGVIGEIIRILIILVFFITAMNMLGLSIVTQVLTQILAYIPNIFAAVIILVAGVLIAGVVEKLVKGSLGTVNIKTARGAAKISSYLVVIITTLAAISQLGIAQSFINTLFTGLVATLVLGLGLSLGLGGKDLVKTILEEWYANLKKDIKHK